MPVSVVVPVYNSEHSLEELARRLHPVPESRDDEYELILVNDRGPSYAVRGFEGASTMDSHPVSPIRIPA